MMVSGACFWVAWFAGLFYTANAGYEYQACYENKGPKNHIMGSADVVPAYFGEAVPPRFETVETTPANIWKTCADRAAQSRKPYFAVARALNSAGNTGLCLLLDKELHLYLPAFYSNDRHRQTHLSTTCGHQGYYNTPVPCKCSPLSSNTESKPVGGVGGHSLAYYKHAGDFTTTTTRTTTKTTTTLAQFKYGPKHTNSCPPGYESIDTEQGCKDGVKVVERLSIFMKYNSKGC